MKSQEAALWMDYGVQCKSSDERQLVKNVNAFLASLGLSEGRRGVMKLQKWKDESIQPPGRTFRIEHYYSAIIRTKPHWYFDLRPNGDLDGRMRFPERPDCAWTLFTSKRFPEMNTPQDDKALMEFFGALVRAVGFPTMVIHIYDDMRQRL